MVHLKLVGLYLCIAADLTQTDVRLLDLNLRQHFQWLVAVVLPGCHYTRLQLRRLLEGVFDGHDATFRKLPLRGLGGYCVKVGEGEGVRLG